MAHGQCSISKFWMNEWIQPSIMEGEIEKEDTDVRDNIKFLVKVEDGI